MCYSRLFQTWMNSNGSVAIIPARFGSSRLPGKPLIQVDGRTLIEHVYRRVQMARGLDRVLVATDDERVRDAVKAFGGEAVLTRGDHTSGTDRLAEVSGAMPGETLIVNVQGDEPLIEPAVIEALLAAAHQRNADVVTVMRELTDPSAIEDRNHVKVVVDRQGQALYFSRSRVPSSGRAFLHLGIYAYSAAFLRTFQALEPSPLEKSERLEQLRILENGFKIRVVEVESEAWGIDTREDLEAFKSLFRTAGSRHAMGVQQ